MCLLILKVHPSLAMVAYLIGAFLSLWKQTWHCCCVMAECVWAQLRSKGL